LNEFLSTPKISTVNKEFFEFFVILPAEEQLAYEIKTEASRLPANIRVHFITPEERYGGLCASDFAILHNGEITVEAAACQLPATVVSSMANARAYL
jgi:lipid A disaccharide synthetase